MFRCLFIIFLLVLLLVANSAGIEVTQSLEPQSIAFENQAEFEIVITWPGPQSRYFFPTPLRPSFERLTAGKFSSSITSTGNGPDEITTKTYKYTLTPHLSGIGQVKPVTIEYISWPDSIPGQLMTDPMSLTISDPVARPKVEQGLNPGQIIMWAGVILLLMGGGLYWLFVIHRRPPEIAKKSPGQQFLEELEDTRLEAGDDLKKFQTGLYRSLVTYLSAKYEIEPIPANAVDMVARLERTKLTLARREKLSDWLIRAEKEKFTPVAGAPGATVRLASEIREFFENEML